MKHIDIRELFNKKQEQMLATFGLSAELTHPVSKGDATEEEWKNWFNVFFPKRYRAEKAFIIDSNGNCSDQIDVVIYDTHFSPLIFEVNKEKYIPAESVYAVFEVKQDLNKEYLQYAKEKIASVKRLTRTSAPINTINGYAKGRSAPIIIGGLLTLRSTWKKDNIETNINNVLTRIICDKNEQIDFICCLSEYACSIDYNQCVSTSSETFSCQLVTDKENSPLIFTYFKLLRMLQDLGNVPAIEYSKYGINGIDPQ